MQPCTQITYADKTAFLHKKYAGILYFSNITSVIFSLFALVFHYIYTHIELNKMCTNHNRYRPIFDENIYTYNYSDREMPLLTEASVNNTGCSSDSDLMCRSYK